MTEARVLVVDDDEVGRYLKMHALERAGFTVVSAATGRDALRLFASDQPEIVLLDVNLPDINGIELCRQIKALPHSTAVLLTSAASIRSADRVIGLENGADTYLIEPIEPDELIAAMGALLRMQRAEQALRRLNETLEQEVANRTRELVDTNQRLLAEKESRAKAEAALWHAQRLDAIGQLTGGIAHEFNNLLTVILGNLDMIEKEMTQSPAISSERISNLIKKGKRAAETCENLTHQLLVFARRDTLRSEITDLNAVIGDLNNFVQQAVGEQVIVQQALARGLWTCRVDPSQFEAALLNLAVNARDAMPRGGVLRIETGNLRIDALGKADTTSFPLATDIIPGDYVGISVADDGTGMADDVLAHAFEPFFTTKDIGKGSGLGLSQVFGFIKQTGGYLGVETVVGKGTRFGIFLPASNEPTTARATTNAPGGDIPKGRGTILVVEDNGMVLEMIVEMIDEMGYRVLQAVDAQTALEIIRGAEAIDLLFTDVVMPNQVNGIELARLAKQHRPDLKVLVTSGFSGHATGGKDAKREFPSIAKPYGRLELAKRLREVLEPA